MSKEESLREYKSRIQRVVDYVEKNIERDLPPNVLAGVASFSPYHFHRIFRAFVGEAPGEFVTRTRLEKAASRLITHLSEPVSEVAFKFGFKSSAAFATAFREHFGCSATDWREGRLTSILNGASRKTDNRKNRAMSSEVPYPVGGAETAMTGKPKQALVKGEIMSMPRFHIAFHIPLEGHNEKIGRLFEKLCDWAELRGFLTAETKFIGTFLDNPNVTPPGKSRYYACVTVPEYIRVEKEVGVKDIPAATCAVSRFEGEQHGIPLAYDEMFGKSIPENGYLPADQPAYEIYHDDMRKHRSRVFTLELCVPVEPL